jgi:PKD repeat protein
LGLPGRGSRRISRSQFPVLTEVLSVLLVAAFLLSTAGAGLAIAPAALRGTGGFVELLNRASIGAQSSSTPLAPAAFGSTALAAAASGTPVKGSAPLLVDFKGSASGGSSPYSYSWNYGGTTTSKSQDPSHTYLYTGSYTATLTVTDAKKATSKAFVAITVSSSVVGVASSLVSGAVIATTPATFFSLNTVTDCSTCIASNAGINSYLNSTPFHWVRYGVDSDSCNISAAKSYSSSGVASAGCGYDLTSLKTWCEAQTPHCHALLTLPGENNNSAEDAAIASWIVKTIGFQPAYWQIGNEPTGWTHYGIAWTKWKTTDASVPSPLAYAFDVKAAITAVAKVDPGAKFIGLETACSCNDLWFQDVAKIDGSSIAAIAYHSYPSDGSTTMSSTQLYALLASSHNLSTTYASVRSLVSGECTSCAKLPIFVNEYNAGPGWAPSTVSGTYANAVFLAASVTQALRANVTQLSVYSLQTTATGSYGFSLMDAAGTVGPTGILYSKLLDHLTVGQVLGTQVKSAVGGVWSVVTKNGTAETLMVVNSNQTSSIALSLGSAFPLTTKGAIYQWDPSLTTPTTTSGLPASEYSIPPQGILLITI